MLKTRVSRTYGLCLFLCFPEEHQQTADHMLCSATRVHIDRAESDRCVHVQR